MIAWSITFLVIALFAAFLGFTGIAGSAVNLAWIMAIVCTVLSIAFSLMDIRRLDQN